MELNIRQAWLTNPAARPGRRMARVKGIVLHWVANPGTTAMANRNYFETGVSAERQNWASAHYIVDPDEVVQAIPDDEMAYHVGATSYNDAMLRKFLTSYPNDCLIGIELCHTDWAGNLDPRTWARAVQLVAELCRKYKLTAAEVVRHYDITGKQCPRLMVRNPAVFERFRAEVQALLDRKPEPAPGSDGADWAAADLAAAQRHSILTGYPDGTLRLNEPVTRLQAAVMIVRALRVMLRLLGKEGVDL